jgi:hypothetical protein
MTNVKLVQFQLKFVDSKDRDCDLVALWSVYLGNITPYNLVGYLRQEPANQVRRSQRRPASFADSCLANFAKDISTVTQYRCKC